MDLYATRSDPLNTDFLDARNSPLYHVSTHRSSPFQSGATKIAKWTPSQTITVAEIEWHLFSQAVLRFQGRSMNVKDYIDKSNIFGRSQHFTSVSGQQYQWDKHVSKDKNGIEVARWHSRSLGVLNSAHPPYLHMAREAVQDIDEIVLTLVYNRHLLQKRKEGVGDGGGGGGGGGGDGGGGGGGGGGGVC